MVEDGGWICCEYCGKKLLWRKPNGLFCFKFGKSRKGGNVIEMEIHGSLKFRCFREECGKDNIINYFPELIKIQNKTE